MRRRAFGGTSSPDQLASWWLLGGSVEWAMLYAAAQEVDFEQQLWDASKAVFQDTSGSDRETLFFLCADGKAKIVMANCKNWKAETPQALVCWVCGCNGAQCLTNFGLEDTIDGWWDVVLPIGAIYRHIVADRRIPDSGLHGVLRAACRKRALSGPNHIHVLSQRFRIRKRQA